MSTKCRNMASIPVRGHARVDILGVGVGGGVGWGGMLTFIATATHTVRSLALPHIRHALLLHVLLHFHTYVMLSCCTFPCTSTHTSCYAAARSLALPHIHHATLLHVLLHFHTYVMLRCCTFSCTSTHTSCYAAARTVLLHFHTYVMLRCCTFLALPHIHHATLLHVLLHFHTYVMLRCCTFSCTSTHTSYATLLHVLLHFHTYEYAMLRARTACYADGCKAWKGASKQQVPQKRLKWQNFAHNRGEFVKHLGGSPRKRVLLWPAHWLKTRLPGSWTHIKTADKTSKIWEVLVCCSLAQERQRQCPEQPRTTLCLKGKKELFGETLDEQNSCFVLVKH